MQALDDRHRDELRASGLTDQTIEASSFYSAEGSVIKKVLGWQCCAGLWGRGMILPYHFPDEAEVSYSRVKLDFPRYPKDKPDRPIKYESPRGAGNRAFFPPGFHAAFDKGGQIVLTEGEKKSLAGTQAAIPTLGLIGVYGWQQKRREVPRKLIPDLASLDWKDRQVVLMFDSDAATNGRVRTAEVHLGQR